MSEKRDYYDVLGVEKSASASDLKNAFRRLARKYHPDRSTEEDAEDRFKEIQEAYVVLSDDQKRLSTTGLGTVDLKVRPSVVLVAVDSTSTSRTSWRRFLFLVFGGGSRRRSTRRGSDILIRHSISSEMSTSVRSKRSKLTSLNNVQPVMVLGRRMAS